MNPKYRRELINIFSDIKNAKLMDGFIEDILTPSEFEEIVSRWQIIKLLSKGVPQRKIASMLNVSISKITRGSRELRDKNGGFWKVLQNISYEK